MTDGLVYSTPTQVPLKNTPIKLMELIKQTDDVINEYLDTIEVDEFKTDVKNLMGRLRTEDSNKISKMKSKIIGFVKTA